MPIASLDQTRSLLNQYFLLRHGESYANYKHLIVGDLVHDATQYGLTQRGRIEVALTITSAQKDGAIKCIDLIVSSPFLRARETAEIAAKILEAPVEIDDRLRERSFGTLELASTDNYRAVWDCDRASAAHTEWGVESAVQVLDRACAAVEEIEGRMQCHSIMLCTHGDVASVLICGFLYQPLELHAQLGEMATGEVRRLVLRSASNDYSGPRTIG